ncbi:hypothetical protein C5S36_05305 [Candidatus Methanophagaceae archaeon]|nr:hypothetical protein C5S36_05305 [Methanophagales archaeon]
MIWIFDSSPLIYLNKVGLNWIFEQLAGDKVDSMIRKGFRLGHEEYQDFLKMLEDIEMS